jgi:hypothetical protein
MHEYTFKLINVRNIAYEYHRIYLSQTPLQTLENLCGKAPVECLALFRHLMVDVVVSSSFGYRLGAVKRWAMDVEDPLSTAINDFPKRGILVNV